MRYPARVPHGIMFHHFHGGVHPRGQGSISGEDFAELLAFVGTERLLSPSEWLEKLRWGQLEEGDLCLTFDDALLCQFEIALPVLERHGVQAFWFVYSSVFEGQIGKLELYRWFRSTRFLDIEEFYRVFFHRVDESEFAGRARVVQEAGAIAQRRASFPFYSDNDVKFRLIRDRALQPEHYERIMDGLLQDYEVNVAEAASGLWMNDQHLRYLSERGHAVGLHSYSHPTVLAGLPAERQAQEYERNAAHLRRVCGGEAVAMAHPCNSYSTRTLDILRRLGIRCGFRSNMVPRREGERVNPDPLELAREDHANIMRRLACGPVQR